MILTEVMFMRNQEQMTEKKNTDFHEQIMHCNRSVAVLVSSRTEGKL